MTEQQALEYLREIAPTAVSIPAVAARFGVEESEARTTILGLDLARLVVAGRGKGGATVYQAVQPGTWIAWKEEA